MLNVPLGTLIYRAGLLTQDEVQGALADSIRADKMLGEVLLERGMVGEAELGRLLAGQKGLPFVELDRIVVDHDVAQRLPEAEARAHSALPVAVDPQGTPLVAVVNPDPSAIAAITSALGAEPHIGVAARGELLSAIDAVFGAEESESDAEQPTLRLADGVPAEDAESGDAHEVKEHVVTVVEPAVQELQTVDAGMWLQPAAEVAEDVEPSPTASAAAEGEPVDEEPASEEESSDSVEPDGGPAFAWFGRDEEISAVRGEVADEPSEDVGVEENLVAEEEPVLALVAAEEQAEVPAPFGEPSLSVSDAELELEADHDDEVHDAFGDEFFVALTVSEPEAEREVEVVSFDAPAWAEEVALEVEPEPEAEVVSVEAEASPQDVVVEVEPETEPAEDMPFVAESVEAFGDDAVFAAAETLEIDDDVAPVVVETLKAADEAVDADDHDAPVMAEAVEAAVDAEVFLSLSNGERLSVGRFAGDEEASSQALSLLADIKRGWWPQVEGRLIRPEAILSIDIENGVTD